MTSNLAHNQILHETLVSQLKIETCLKNKHMRWELAWLQWLKGKLIFNDG